MEISSRVLLGSSLLLAFTVVASAQDAKGPSKVLTIQREYTKPGKGGSVHEKSEAAFVQIYARAKNLKPYVAASAITGKPRVLFFTAYDSFDAWQKDVEQTDKPGISAALDRATASDGELLESSDQAAFVYRPDYSLRTDSVEIATMRYLDIAAYHLKPGSEHQMDEIMKIVLAAAEKSMPHANWACYQSRYGAPEGVFLFITPLKDASEIDRNLSENKGFGEALGEAGGKKLNELAAAAVESSEGNLFSFSPRMSYPPEEWIKTDPDFWKPKAAPATKPANDATKEKPAQ
jgi:hypothetical protein